MLGGCTLVAAADVAVAATAAGDPPTPAAAADDADADGEAGGFLLPPGEGGAALAAAEAEADATIAALCQRAQVAALDSVPALGAFSGYVAELVAELALLAGRLPALSVLELTFALPGLVPALQCLADTEVCGGPDVPAVQSACVPQPPCCSL